MIHAHATRPLLTEAELDRIAQRFAAEPEGTRHALRAWLEVDPVNLTRLAVRRLGRDPKGVAATSLAILLSIDQLYVTYLTDPAELSQEEAVNSARVLAARDVRFFIKLTSFAGDSLPGERIARVLQIVEALGAAGVIVPWLRRITSHSDDYIRQKAVMIMCQAGTNPLLVERQLHSPDARVRANAVESLWGVNTTAARALLEHATHDNHHRVVANALVGLFLQGDGSAIDRMSALSGHSSPAFRIAAAWALGLTRRAEAWPALNALRSDPVSRVRESAERALQKVPPPADPGTQLDDPPQQDDPPAEKAGLRVPQFRMVS